MYRTFWRRVWAAFFDFLILMPPAAALFWYWPRLTSPTLQIALFVLASMYGVAYSILLHAKWGQTFGKMATGVRVIDVAGGPIGLRQALRRDSPALVLSIASTALGIRDILAGEYALMPASEGPLSIALGAAGFIWSLAEILTMVTNPRRRAIHDLIARTVVVKTRLPTDV